MKVNIKSWLEEDSYKRLKKEVCTDERFESRIYSEDGTAYGLYGTMHSTTLFTHTALLRDILSKRKLFGDGQLKFLDLGSGVGNLLIYAAEHGWKAKGIEFSKPCYKASLENIKIANEAEIEGVDEIEVEYANFFPENFMITRMAGDKKEDDFREVLQPMANKAPRTKINLGEIDLFYHYQVERRQNILNLFSSYAKPNAMLVFVETREDSFKIPENVKELDYHFGMSIYQKKE